MSHRFCIVYEQQIVMVIRRCLQHTNKAERVLEPVRVAPECWTPMSTTLIRSMKMIHACWCLLSAMRPSLTPFLPLHACLQTTNSCILGGDLITCALQSVALWTHWEMRMEASWEESNPFLCNLGWLIWITIRPAQILCLNIVLISVYFFKGKGKGYFNLLQNCWVVLKVTSIGFKEIVSQFGQVCPYIHNGMVMFSV